MQGALDALKAAGIKPPAGREKSSSKNDPNYMIKLQAQLRNNSTDIQNYVQDLDSW